MPNRPPTSRCGPRPSRWHWPPSRARCSTPREGRASRTQLATSPTGEASALDVGDAIRYSVAPGRGRLRPSRPATATSSGGQQWVVDSGGTRYRLGGKGVETAEQLGYGGYDVPTIPDAWIEQFGCGAGALHRRPRMSEPDAEAATGSCEQ